MLLGDFSFSFQRCKTLVLFVMVNTGSQIDDKKEGLSLVQAEISAFTAPPTGT